MRIEAMKEIKIALVGGRSLVLKRILELLIKEDVKEENITIFGSSEAKGQIVLVESHQFEISELCPENIGSFDLVFFSGKDSISEKYAPIFVLKGAKVIDNSSYFRLEDKIPLVAHHVNDLDLLEESNIIANPNCVTIMLARVLKPLHDDNPIEKAIISTYQSASGMGNVAYHSLKKESQAYLSSSLLNSMVFPTSSSHKKSPLSFNIIPQVDVIYQNGYTLEEEKIYYELKKILHQKDFESNVTAVRVPTLIGHGAMVHLTFKNEIDIDRVYKILNSTDGVVIADEYGDLFDVIGKDLVAVSRIRKDHDCPYGLVLFMVSDNLLLGAASNAVEIMKKLIEYKLL